MYRECFFVCKVFEHVANLLNTKQRLSVSDLEKHPQNGYQIPSFWGSTDGGTAQRWDRFKSLG